MVDTPDLGSGATSVQVQVLSSAPNLITPNLILISSDSGFITKLIAMNIIKNNSWNPINEKQKESALLWTKQYVMLTVLVPAFSVLLLFSCLITLAITTHIKHDQNSADRIEAVIASFFGIGLIVIFLLMIRKEIGKITAIKRGTALITEVTVISKSLKRASSRSSAYCVRVKGLYENNKPVERDIIVTKRLYDSVSPNDKGYAIRFDPADNNVLPQDLGYIPG